MDRIVDSGINLLNNMGQAFCAHAGSAFVQSSVLIVVLLALDLLLRKRVRAVVRYSIWMLVFVKLLLPPTLSLPTGMGYYWPRSTAVHQKMMAEETISTAPATLVRSQPIPRTAPSEDVIEVSDAVTGPVSAALPPTSLASVRPAVAWQAAVFLGWLTGVVLLGICVARRVRYVGKLVRASTPAPNSLQEALAQCAAKLGLRRCPQLRLSDDAPGPVVCRLLSPVVLMPTTLADKMSEDRLRTVLVHELAHIKRADLWVNFVQTLLLVAYFYHPLLWLVNAIVRRLREQAVDETVLVALDADAKGYSTTLIDLAEMTFKRPILGLRLIMPIKPRPLAV
jgi:beta-lactamase regulating signal transducer with metallopeptidase domain